MSSTNPAFVKAFARRNRAVSQSPTRPHASMARSTEVSEPVSEPDVGVAGDATSPPQEHSAAGNSSVWVDTVQEQFARADQPTTAPPIPHVDLPNEPISSNAMPVDETLLDEKPAPVHVDPVDVPAITDSLQHIHTAYATAPADLAYYRLDTTQTPEIEAASVTDSEVNPFVQISETESRIGGRN